MGTTVMCERFLIDKLPGDLKRLAEIAGIETALRIAIEFRGTNIYIGNIDALFRELRDLKIRQDFDSGLKVKTIAVRYGLTERRIWNILGSIGEIPEDILKTLGDFMDSNEVKKN